MAKAEHQIPDCNLNPECILMTIEDDEAECDVSESRWLSSTHVTKPKQSNYNGDNDDK